MCGCECYEGVVEWRLQKENYLQVFFLDKEKSGGQQLNQEQMGLIELIMGQNKVHDRVVHTTETRIPSTFFLFRF